MPNCNPSFQVVSSPRHSFVPCYSLASGKQSLCGLGLLIVFVLYCATRKERPNIVTSSTCNGFINSHNIIYRQLLYIAVDMAFISKHSPFVVHYFTVIFCTQQCAENITAACQATLLAKKPIKIYRSSSHAANAILANTILAKVCLYDL